MPLRNVRIAPAVFLLSVVASVTLCGCGAQQMYSGASRSATDVATLVPRSGVPLEVDGEVIGSTRSAVEILPGRHTMHAETTPGGYYSPGEKRERRTIEFDAQAGRVYHVRGSSNYRACVWVVDAESEEIVSFDSKGCGRREPLPPLTPPVGEAKPL